MARQKGDRDWERKSYSLDKTTTPLIQEGKHLNGLKSDGAFIDFAVAQYFINSDPMKQLDNIKNNKEKLKHELDILEIKERECIERINFIQKWRQNGFVQEKKIVQNMARMIIQGRKIDAEETAVIQSAKLGITKEDLLMKACGVAEKI